MTVELDGRMLTSREVLHDSLAQALSFPEYYGRNLDALYDLLSERGEKTVIIVNHIPELERNLGHYGTCFLAALQDAANVNAGFTVHFEKKESEE